MTTQQLLDAIAQSLAGVSAPLHVHQQLVQIIKQAQEAINQASKPEEPTE